MERKETNAIDSAGEQEKLSETICSDDGIVQTPLNCAEELYSMALKHIAKGEYDQAVALMHRSLEILPDQPHVWFELGNMYAKLQQFRAAYEAYKQSVVRQPAHVHSHVNIGIMCRYLHSFREAEAALKMAIYMQEDHVEAWRNLAIVYKTLGDTTAALNACDRALEYCADNPLLHVNMANIFKSMGERQKAKAAYATAIKLNPDFAVAHRLLAEVHSYTDRTDPHIAQMLRLIEKTLIPQQDTMQLSFALAKAYHDVGIQQKSWEFLEQANRLKRSERAYDDEMIAQWFASIAQSYHKPDVFVGNKNSKLEESPIFIVGMPRSGTSLVEQIVASHHVVHGAGELDEMRLLVQHVWPRWFNGNYPHGAEQLSELQQAQLAGEYMRMTSQYMPKDKARMVDKMPGNFRFVGLIHQIFPHAKIIHCLRDPMDTCVSIYRHYFEGSHPYAYDLRELGSYYRHYQRLMEHWRNVLPEGVMLDMTYEELVHNSQFHTRRLLDFCNLSWDDACLAFHETERPVHTASAMQVRQPIYTKAIGKWKKESDYLQPLLDALNA